MPAGFDRCVKKGGKVRRISGPSKRWGLRKGEYVNVCFLGGKMWRGETKTMLGEMMKNRKGRKGRGGGRKR